MPGLLKRVSSDDGVLAWPLSVRIGDRGMMKTASTTVRPSIFVIL